MLFLYQIQRRAMIKILSKMFLAHSLLRVPLVEQFLYVPPVVRKLHLKLCKFKVFSLFYKATKTTQARSYMFSE